MIKNAKEIITISLVFFCTMSVNTKSETKK